MIPQRKNDYYNNRRLNQVKLKEALESTSSSETINISSKKSPHGLIQSLFLILTTVLICSFAAMFCLLIYRYSMINELKCDIFDQKMKVKELSQEVDYLNVELNKSVALNTIEEYATNKLGMQFPKQEQIVYISSTFNYSLKEPKETLALVEEDALKINEDGIVDQVFKLTSKIVDTFE